jgi:hypothetical protein
MITSHVAFVLVADNFWLGPLKAWHAGRLQVVLVAVPA